MYPDSSDWLMLMKDRFKKSRVLSRLLYFSTKITFSRFYFKNVLETNPQTPLNGLCLQHLTILHLKFVSHSLDLQ